MLKLGVNIDHIATLRQARYRGHEKEGEPDPVIAAQICEEAGAHGITAHLREDRRHIQDYDVFRLREIVKTKLNLEMANVPEIISIVLKVKPDIVCIVPERRGEITTEGGLDVKTQLDKLQETILLLHENKIEVSLFIDPDPIQVEAAKEAGSRFIELHTGAFAEAFRINGNWKEQLRRLRNASCLAVQLGLNVNAGHGLNYQNLPLLLKYVPYLVELNIGHSIISRAVFVGLFQAVKEMLQILEGYDPLKPLDNPLI